MRHREDGRAVRTDDVSHADRVRLLGEVSTGGLSGLLRVLHRAHTGGDPAALDMALSSLLRAVPGMGAITVHELIAAEGIREDQPLGAIDPGRVAGLLRTLEERAEP